MLYPDHRFPPWTNEDDTRDRSNRLLDVSRSEINSRAIRNDPVQFFNLRIRDSNTTNRPIHETVRSADPTETVVNPVNHNVTTRIVTGRACSRDISSRRVRYMKSSVERAIGIVSVDEILTFRGAAITLTQLWANWVATQGDGVGAEQHTVRIREKLVLCFLNNQ
jgi:hypothetical protein